MTRHRPTMILETDTTIEAPTADVLDVAFVAFVASLLPIMDADQADRLAHRYLGRFEGLLADRGFVVRQIGNSSR